MKKKTLMVMAVIALMTAAAQADLRLWLNFEEDSTWQSAGYVQDQSVYANHGQVEDAWSCGTPTYVAGPQGGNAMQFGYGSYEGMSWNNVQIAKSASLANLGQAWSMGGWVKIDSVAGYNNYSNYPKIISCPNYEIIGNAPGDPAGYFWPWDESPTWGNPGSWDVTTANVASYNGSWMHLIYTYDGTTLTEYINGNAVFTATNFAHPFDNATWDDPTKYWTDSPMKIGAALAGYPDVAGWLIGALDDIGIRSDYLNADLVEGLYDGTYTWASVPEPATIAMLTLGALLLRKRLS